MSTKSHPSVSSDITVLTSASFELPDGSALGSRFIGMGRTGIVLQQGRNALEIPKLRNLTSVPASCYSELLFSNEMNREKLRNELEVLRRLGNHPGIIRCLEEFEEGIAFPFLKKGSLRGRIRQKENSPSSSVAVKWIKSIAEALCHCHEKRVLVADIALRNILLDEENNVILIDFADSILLPLETNMEEASDGDISVQTEIFHFACVAMSILTWQENEYDLYATPPESTSVSDPLTIKWPSLETLPCTTNVLFGEIIRKCCVPGTYQNMSQVRDDIAQSSE